MSGPRRIELTPGYLLHHRPWRDTSRILEVFTREHGRLTLFARGVRGPAAKLAPLLQPFQMLLLSWSGRGEAPALTGAERAEAAGVPLPAACLLPAFYLNELLLKLTTRHDPLPQLFDHYHQALTGLRQEAGLEPALRLFEKRLLEALGYGLALSAEAGSGEAVDPERFYLFRTAQGLVPAAAGAPGALAGRSLLALEAEDLAGPRALEDARLLLKAALDACLEGRPLVTRVVARALVRRGISP
ncbi:MAG: DNA repair protein RecO [Proteobacteria bacterium]|nr:DNA repair protein RecO [Pseudomonadota bacterium]